MALGGGVGLAGDAAGSLDPNRARRDAAQQKFVMQISAAPEQLLTIRLIHSSGSGQGAIGVVSYSTLASFCATAWPGAAMR